MIPRSNITAWRASVPWPDDAQVEQDLVLSRVVVETFADPAISKQLVLRGGTALNKLFIATPARYSEDIDLVQKNPGPIGDTLDAIRGHLDPWLGEPARQRAADSVTLLYRFESEIQPVRPLRLKIEINTREHFSILDLQVRACAVENPWFHGNASVNVYQLDELSGTKMRALYQRKKGRDLFDLWLALDRGLIEPAAVIKCFRGYMDFNKTPVSRAQFEANLTAKAHDPAFHKDIEPLLAPGIRYDPQIALNLVREKLVTLLPGEPWKGSK